MTIVVGVAAPDGIILAADSRTTLTFGERHRIGSDFAQKVFPICETIAVATYGWAFIGGRTIAGLMDEFVAQLDDQIPSEASAIAEQLGTFFDAKVNDGVEPEQLEELKAQGLYPLGFLVAGYDADGIGRIHEVALPGPYIAEAEGINTANLGIMYRGQIAVVRRLLEGIDRDELAVANAEIPAELEPALGNLTYNLLFPMTLQDAVDCAAFIIRTTIDMQRFSDGTLGRMGELPGCGGPIRILATTRAGVEWVADAPLTGATAPGIAEGGARV